MLVCVAGNVGSGKTTVSSLVARHTDGRIAETRVFDESYLTDQFTDPKRWSFEAQMALLGAKAIGIRNAQYWGGTVIVDRSMQEDTQIFARYFLEHGFLDHRAHHMYVEYADLLAYTLPSPDVMIYCRCSPSECSTRIKARARSYQQLYPSDFVERLSELYEDWWARLSAPLRVVVDTDVFDLRVPASAKEFLQFFQEALATLPVHSDSQLSLFQTPEPSLALPNRPLVFEGSLGPFTKRRIRCSPMDAPLVYLAAPFTGLATERRQSPVASGRLLLDLDEPHGAIPASEYRSSLLSAARELERQGFRTLLPHRDINRWGDKSMLPSEVARKCLEGVRRSSLVLAVLSTSFGTHVEAAAALAWGIPVILVRENGSDESFFATALRTSGLCASVTVDGLSELGALISSDHFTRVLNDALDASRDLHLRLADAK